MELDLQSLFGLHVYSCTHQYTKVFNDVIFVLKALSTLRAVETL
jgi:hypothetical protein